METVGRIIKLLISLTLLILLTDFVFCVRFFANASRPLAGFGQLVNRLFVLFWLKPSATGISGRFT
jgi:hypothetical protein